MTLPHDDAVTVAPDLHKLVFENEQFRMLDIIVPPGAKAALHRHPKNDTYIIADGTLRFTGEHGTSKDIAFTAGQLLPMPKTRHAVENIGTTTFRAIQIEFTK